jgi:hypothetical protein
MAAPPCPRGIYLRQGLIRTPAHRAKKASAKLDPASASGIYGRGVTSWPPISRDDLKEAAGRAGFDTVFPELIRRLIAETAIGLGDVDMPVGSGTALTGFDGVITAREESPFVPVGTSVWELSVSSSGHGRASLNASRARNDLRNTC